MWKMEFLLLVVLGLFLSGCRQNRPAQVCQSAAQAASQPASLQMDLIECEKSEARGVLQVTLRPEKLADDKREFYLRQKPRPKPDDWMKQEVWMEFPQFSDYTSPNGGFGTGSCVDLENVTNGRARLHVTFYCIGKGSPANYDLDKTVEIPLNSEQTIVLSEHLKLMARYVPLEKR